MNTPFLIPTGGMVEKIQQLNIDINRLQESGLPDNLADSEVVKSLNAFQQATNLLPDKGMGKGLNQLITDQRRIAESDLLFDSYAAPIHKTAISEYKATDLASPTIKRSLSGITPLIDRFKHWMGNYMRITAFIDIFIKPFGWFSRAYHFLKPLGDLIRQLLALLLLIAALIGIRILH